MIPVEALLTREIFQAESLGKTEYITKDAAAEEEEENTAPAGKTEQKPADYSELKAGAVVVSMESEDPYGDFRRSMEEMVLDFSGTVQ